MFWLNYTGSGDFGTSWSAVGGDSHYHSPHGTEHANLSRLRNNHHPQSSELEQERPSIFAGNNIFAGRAQMIYNHIRTVPQEYSTTSICNKFREKNINHHIALKPQKQWERQPRLVDVAVAMGHQDLCASHGQEAMTGVAEDPRAALARRVHSSRRSPSDQRT